MEEMGNNGKLLTQEELRSMLRPLTKSQLVNLLCRLGSENPTIAEEIKSLANSDLIHRKLYIHGLAPNTTEETLNAAFRIHGKIEEVAVIRKKATGKSLGYGFITYKHKESAHSALREPSKLIDGRKPVYHLAHDDLSGANTAPGLAQKQLYIGGLSPDVTSEMLKNYFGRHGQIVQGSVVYDKETHASRGFGFITYETVEAAKKAINDPRKSLGGNTISVELAYPRKRKAVETLPSAVVVPPTAPSCPTAAPAGYTHPQTIASYPAQPTIPYAPLAADNNPQGIPTTKSMGLGEHIRKKLKE